MSPLTSAGNCACGSVPVVKIAGADRHIRRERVAIHSRPRRRKRQARCPTRQLAMKCRIRSHSQRKIHPRWNRRRSPTPLFPRPLRRTAPRLVDGARDTFKLPLIVTLFKNVGLPAHPAVLTIVPSGSVTTPVKVGDANGAAPVI